MSSVDSSFVLLPRFTTLVGGPPGTNPSVFTSLPMDVSAYGGAQFQVWRGPFRTKSATPAAKFEVHIEESLDTETWVLGAGVPAAIEITTTEPRFLSYSFRLRWFRLKVALRGDEPIVSCWAEGLLRGGTSGLFPPPPTGSAAGSVDLPGSDRLNQGRKATYQETRAWALEYARQTGLGDWDPVTGNFKLFPKL